MSTFINFSLFTVGVLSLGIGILNDFNERSNKSTFFYFLFQGFFTFCWCGGYAIMGTCQTEASALVWRNVGLFGVMAFLVTETYFLSSIAGVFSRYKKTVLSIVTLIAIVDYILFAGSVNVRFVWNNGRMVYYASSTMQRYFHDFVVALFFVVLLMIGLYWGRKVELEREKRTIQIMIWSNFSILFFTLPDTFLPMFGIASFPSTGYGAFITYAITYYVAVKKNAFKFSQSNLGKYIYQYVNSPVLIFDHRNKLMMANDYALKFFEMQSVNQQSMGDIFEISKPDSEMIFSGLQANIGKTCQLTSCKNQKMCALTFTLITDKYNKPYCSIGMVYDLSRESALLNELTKVKTQLENQLEKKSKQVEGMNLQTITTIANIIDARDEYTKGHSIRVAEYCERLARELGWSEDDVQNIKYVALLHDLGKVGVPDSVLNKPGKLTDVEYHLIQSHTVIGDEIIKDISMIPNLHEGIRYHHERWNGTGYPDGLCEEEIPEIARIIAIADSYDAMKSNRVYRKHLEDSVIYHEIETGSGKQFSPEYAKVFLELLKNGRMRLDETEQVKEETFENESTKLFHRVMDSVETEEDRDYLTSLLGRKTGEKMITSEMKNAGGCLALIDLDNLKYVNDIYGHLAGDCALKTVGSVLADQGAGMITTRYGGDEFLVFMPKYDITQATSAIESIFMLFQSRKENENFMEQTSLSAGLYMCDQETVYAEAIRRADKALYYVKQNGKRGYFFYMENTKQNVNESSVDLKNIIRSLQVQGNYHGAYNVGRREFSNIYMLISSMAQRYDYGIQLLMITVSPISNDTFTVEQEESAFYCMEKAISDTLRNADVSTRFSNAQMLLILNHTDRKYVGEITERIFNRFFRIYAKDDVKLSYDVAEYNKK